MASLVIKGEIKSSVLLSPCVVLGLSFPCSVLFCTIFPSYLFIFAIFCARVVILICHVSTGNPWPAWFLLYPQYRLWQRKKEVISCCIIFTTLLRQRISHSLLIELHRIDFTVTALKQLNPQIQSGLKALLCTYILPQTRLFIRSSTLFSSLEIFDRYFSCIISVLGSATETWELRLTLKGGDDSTVGRLRAKESDVVSASPLWYAFDRPVTKREREQNREDIP